MQSPICETAVSEGEAEAGMREMSETFREKGGEIYLQTKGE